MALQQLPARLVFSTLIEPPNVEFPFGVIDNNSLGIKPFVPPCTSFRQRLGLGLDKFFNVVEGQSKLTTHDNDNVTIIAYLGEEFQSYGPKSVL
ncbi:hypothetical protein P9112_000979 [Eukaryota sp. TZLM1-RC]